MVREEDCNSSDSYCGSDMIDLTSQALLSFIEKVDFYWGILSCSNLIMILALKVFVSSNKDLGVFTSIIRNLDLMFRVVAWGVSLILYLLNHFFDGRGNMLHMMLS